MMRFFFTSVNQRNEEINIFHLRKRKIENKLYIYFNIRIKQIENIGEIVFILYGR